MTNIESNNKLTIDPKKEVKPINETGRLDRLEKIKQQEAYGEDLSKAPIGPIFNALDPKEQVIFVQKMIQGGYTPEDISVGSARCMCGSIVGSNGTIIGNNIMYAYIGKTPLIGKTPRAMGNEGVEKKGDNYYFKGERIPYASEIIGKIPVPLSLDAISRGIKSQSAKELLETGDANIFNNIIDNFDKIAPEDKNIILGKIKELYGSTFQKEYPGLMNTKALSVNVGDRLLFLPDVRNSNGKSLGFTFGE